jgi:HSP20 family protein
VQDENLHGTAAGRVEFQREIRPGISDGFPRRGRSGTEKNIIPGGIKMKTVTMYRPFALEKALEDFDRYMESFFKESPLTPAYQADSLPAVDIREIENAYELEAELPGYDEKDIHIHVDNGTLTIESGKEESRDVSPKREAGNKKEAFRYLLRERRNVSFSRSFKLPENADVNGISANFKNGLLTLEIKKLPEAQKKVIQIGGNRG